MDGGRGSPDRLRPCQRERGAGHHRLALTAAIRARLRTWQNLVAWPVHGSSSGRLAPSAAAHVESCRQREDLRADELVAGPPALVKVVDPYAVLAVGAGHSRSNSASGLRTLTSLPSQGPPCSRHRGRFLLDRVGGDLEDEPRPCDTHRPQGTECPGHVIGHPTASGYKSNQPVARTPITAAGKRTSGLRYQGKRQRHRTAVPMSGTWLARRTRSPRHGSRKSQPSPVPRPRLGNIAMATGRPSQQHCRTATRTA